MQCVTPMFRQYNFSTGETVRIVPRSEVMENLSMDPNAIRFQLNKMNEMYRARNLKIQTIPCGHCYACKLTKSAEWATRCMLETLDHKESYFITLTYDEKHLPILEHIDLKNKETGEKYRIENDGTWIEGSLVPEDVSKFIRSLRDHYRKEGINNIRYFYCGEYG